MATLGATPKIKKKKGTRITLPNSPITGRGPTPGTAGYDPFGFPDFPKGSGYKKHGFFSKMLKNAPPFMGDFSMYNTAIGSINDILARHGQLPPEILQRSQAAIEAQRQNAARSWQARAAEQGIDPNSDQYNVVQSGLNQMHDIAQQNERFNQAQAAQTQERSDLNLINPFMQMLMGYTQPKGRNSQITPAPVGAPAHTDWGGIASGLANTYLKGAAPGPGQTNWNWGLS